MYESLEIPYPCPSCPPYKSPKCFLNSRKKCFHCYRCNASGRAGVSLDVRGEVGVRESTTSALPNFSPLSEFATEYLLGRGISLHLIEHLPIWTTDSGILFEFPEFGYWQERNWSTTGKPRWLGPSSPKASEGVTYRLAGPQAGEVVLVEGVGDALKVASAGFTTAALLSKRLYASQAARLAQRYRKAVLLLDRDVSPASWLTAAAVAREFFQSLRLVRVHRHADPGEMSLDAIQEVLG